MGSGPFFVCLAFEKINYFERKYHVDPHSNSLFIAYKHAKDGKWDDDDSMLIQMLRKWNNATKKNASKKKKIGGKIAITKFNLIFSFCFPSYLFYYF